MQRISVPELLDSDAGTPREIADSLDDLRRINRFLGGHSTTKHLLTVVKVAKRVEQMSYLDVGGASSTSPEMSEITVLDRDPGHLRLIGTRRVCGDAFNLPFREGSFDVVGSSLLLHHFEPKQVVPFLMESLRVARHAVIVNDLRRSQTHLAFTQVGRLIYKSRITSFDAPASVRRAYTPEELLAMVRPLQLSYELHEHFFFRIGLVLFK